MSNSHIFCIGDSLDSNAKNNMIRYHMDKKWKNVDVQLHPVYPLKDSFKYLYDFYVQIAHLLMREGKIQNFRNLKTNEYLILSVSLLSNNILKYYFQ